MLRASTAGSDAEASRLRFAPAGWIVPYWHSDIGAAFFQAMQSVNAFLLGRRTYQIHGEAFEPMPPGDPFGDLMNAPKKYVVSRTLTKPIWRDTIIIRDNVVEAVRSLEVQPGKDILTDGVVGLHIWIGVEDIDPLFAEYRRKGVQFLQAPAHRPWAYEMQVMDPDGHVLRFGSEPREAPEQPGAT